MSCLLFRNGCLKSNSSDKIKVLPYKGDEIKISQFQIDCFDKESLKPVEIELSNIYYNNSPIFNNCDDKQRCTTAMFRKETPLQIKIEYLTDKGGLDFHFHNPLNKDVRVFITLVCRD